ncbi:unnamed protein product [Caenorhabditis auriculariae]|uniref:Uncharacterized protein n=1 Tax=Caenorhabditis auriculariae TaxID=2777116 RepID=A0A8S1GPQ2_9PELO|nr:unnamed protein product [Caenorhabditis auriculariae]
MFFFFFALSAVLSSSVNAIYRDGSISSEETLLQASSVAPSVTIGEGSGEESETLAVESTTRIISSTAEPLETSTDGVLVLETTTIDEEGFLGFKRPDLATIYRRIFPFRHLRNGF